MSKFRELVTAVVYCGAVCVFGKTRVLATLERACSTLLESGTGLATGLNAYNEPEGASAKAKAASK